MHFPLLHHSTRTAIRLSMLAREHTSAIRIFFSAMVAIIIVLAIAGWPHNKGVTFVINSEDLVCLVQNPGESEQ